MDGTNEFAIFCCRSIYSGGGGPESGQKKSKKCLPAGTGTKIDFANVNESAKGGGGYRTLSGEGQALWEGNGVSQR